jgi:hypothetical protein
MRHLVMFQRKNGGTNGMPEFTKAMEYVQGADIIPKRNLRKTKG